MERACGVAFILLMVNGAGASNFIRGSALAAHQLTPDAAIGGLAIADSAADPAILARPYWLLPIPDYIPRPSWLLPTPPKAHISVPLGVSQTHAIDWTTVCIGAAIGALLGAAIISGAASAMGSKVDSKKGGDKGNDKQKPLLAATEQEEGSSPTDYAELLKSSGIKISEKLGPKLEKGGAVRDMLESRMGTFADKAKNFMLSELNGTAGAVMREVEAEESMLMLEWSNAVEANLPPAPILVAGVFSPSVIQFMSLHHFVQMVTVGLPIFVLCVFAIYQDWNAPCSIPTLFPWLYTQTVLAFLMFVGHAVLFAKLSSGRRTLAAKKAEVQGKNLQEQFIANTIILQEALLIENGVRHSIWNTVVGLATLIFLLTTIWNLVLVCGWVFVPGVVAFHPDLAASAGAKGEYCGAWATVLVLKISMLLSILYFWMNLATVVQWFCDMMVGSKGFSDIVLARARKSDKTTGLPIVEMLAKAFVLRGGDEALMSRLAVVQHNKKSLQNKQADLKSQLAQLNGKIESVTDAQESLQVKAKDGGDLAAAVQKLNSNTIDYESWKKQGDTAIEEAESKAVEIGTASTDDLEKLHQNMSVVIASAQTGLDQAKEQGEKAAAAYQKGSSTGSSLSSSLSAAASAYQTGLEQAKEQAAAQEVAAKAQSKKKPAKAEGKK